MLGFLGTGVFVECLKQVRTSHVSDGGSAVGSTYRRVTPHLGLELSCSSVLKDPTRPQMPRGGEGWLFDVGAGEGCDAGLLSNLR